MSPISEERAEHIGQTMALLMRKLLLGDDVEKRLSEEHGPAVATAHAITAAKQAGRCICSRGGVICGRILQASEGPACWPCWANRRDRRACGHSPITSELSVAEKRALRTPKRLHDNTEGKAI
jgi:hypothetical protein